MLRHLHTGCNSMLICPLQGKRPGAIGQLGTWAALLDTPSMHWQDLSWQMLCHLMFLSSGEQAQAGAVSR